MSSLVACEKDNGEASCSVESGPEYGQSVTDIDGNTYKTVIIGKQEWMAENLKTTKFNDSTEIPNYTDESQWANADEAAYCWYDNEESNKETTGALYNAHAANNDKLCPQGWHTPTGEEWRNLDDFIIDDGWESKEAEALKATSGWELDGTNGTDIYGFESLPTNYRSEDGSFTYGQYETIVYYWHAGDATATSGLQYVMTLGSVSGVISYLRRDMRAGAAVRCIKD